MPKIDVSSMSKSVTIAAGSPRWDLAPPSRRIDPVSVVMLLLSSLLLSLVAVGDKLIDTAVAAAAANASSAPAGGHELLISPSNFSV